MTKGRMKRVNSYEVECGAHGCSIVSVVRDAADARALGWFRETKDGYGWICPDCQAGGPLPVPQ